MQDFELKCQKLTVRVAIIAISVTTGAANAVIPPSHTGGNVQPSGWGRNC